MSVGEQRDKGQSNNKGLAEQYRLDVVNESAEGSRELRGLLGGHGHHGYVYLLQDASSKPSSRRVFSPP